MDVQGGKMSRSAEQEVMDLQIELANLRRELAETREALECQVKYCSNGQIHVTAKAILGSQEEFRIGAYLDGTPLTPAEAREVWQLQQNPPNEEANARLLAIKAVAEHRMIESKSG
jgi:predicted lipid-binding transport protein (Tim44 family)